LLFTNDQESHNTVVKIGREWTTCISANHIGPNDPLCNSIMTENIVIMLKYSQR